MTLFYNIFCRSTKNISRIISHILIFLYSRSNRLMINYILMIYILMVSSGRDFIGGQVINVWIHLSKSWFFENIGEHSEQRME
jgi:hypothetical protein